MGHLCSENSFVMSLDFRPNRAILDFLWEPHAYLGTLAHTIREERFSTLLSTCAGSLVTSLALEVVSVVLVSSFNHTISRDFTVTSFTNTGMMINVDPLIS